MLYIIFAAILVISLLTLIINHIANKDIKSSMEILIIKMQAALISQAKNEADNNHKLQMEYLNTMQNNLDKRLNDGFEKTAATFTDIVKRLALIDEAQKRIVELSNSVVGLQQILTDKRSRGAFGEVQLKNLIHNMLPAENYQLQYTLSNGAKVDCILFLPDPTGNLAIDAKFPLENFQKMTAFEKTEDQANKKIYMQNFKQDIKKHILDIATKYIIKGETADGAIMFIPAEAIFAEIHHYFPDLVELAQKNQVWLASPTTMMAIITTASAVIKDLATKKHIHIIQEHLQYLAKDFMRFEERITKLTKHIEKAHEDAHSVNASARKITERFKKIESAELVRPDVNLELEEERE